VLVGYLAEVIADTTRGQPIAEQDFKLLMEVN
jgi:hypothetical protein